MKISAKHTEVLLYVSLQTKAVYAASEQQYTAAGGDVQLPTGYYLPLSLCGHKTGAFKHRKVV